MSFFIYNFVVKTLIKITVKYQDRIDKYIAKNSSISRSDTKKLIEEKVIFVDDKLIRKANFRVKENSTIRITKIIYKEINAIPENIKIDVVHEDDDIIIINKKSGMVVHPAPGNYSGTLVNALLFRFKKLSNINGKIRPGIVHRIDKDTSGLLVVAKHNESHRVLTNDIKNHKIKRTYLCWVKGKMENDVTHINLPIGRDPKNRKKMTITEINSKHAITHVYVEKILENKTLIRCELETGRTHQIRVHLAHIKHPILGDPLYGKKVDDFGQKLHAYKLEFIHPITKKKIKFKVKPPKDFDL